MAKPKKFPSMDRIADLQQLIADFAKIERMPQLADNKRRENDVEHSFGLAITCWFLAPKIAPELDMQKIFKYALAHDIVELYSDDTFVYDQAAVKTKIGREKDALKRLKSEWPDFSELTGAAQKYMDKAEPESRFVYTIDKMLPSIMVNLGEKNQFWSRHKITQKMEADEKRGKMKHSPEAQPYLELLLEWLANPNYYYEPDQTS